MTLLCIHILGYDFVGFDNPHDEYDSDTERE